VTPKRRADYCEVVSYSAIEKQMTRRASRRRWASPLLRRCCENGAIDGTLSIEGLNRDVLKKRSIVMLKWDDDPEKRLGLVVPFDCTLDNLRAETEKAVRALARESETATIQGP
jgi:hypothetical protein